jgi:ligand-binding sensor domain-containing protein
MIRTRVYLSSCCFLLYLAAVSQSLRFENYTTRQGLTTNDVFNLHQDNRGYIWLFGPYGTLRFNGITFKPVLENLPLRERFVYSCFENKSGRMWIATANANIFEVRNDSAIQVLGLDSISDLFRKDVAEILQLQVDDSLNLFVISKKYCFKIQRTSSGYRPINLNSGKKDTLAYYKLIEHENQVLTIYPNRTLWFLKRDHISLELKIENRDTTIQLFGHIQGTIKVCKKLRDEICFAHETRFGRIRRDGSVRYTFLNSIINNFTIDSRGHYWVGCFNGGLYELSPEGTVLSHYFENLTVNDVLVDTQNELWVSTSHMGLYCCHNLYHHYFTENETLGKPLSFLKLVDGMLIAADANGSIYRIYNEGNIVRLHQNKDYGQPMDIITGDGYFLSGNRKSIEVLSVTGKSISQLIDSDGYPYYAHSFYRQSHDTIISVQRKGITRIINRKPEKTIQLDFKTYAAIQWKSKLLICTENGVYEFTNNHAIQPPFLSKTAGISVQHPVYDKEGNLWFCTEGSGLFTLTSSGKLRHFAGRENLPSNIVYRLTFTNEGKALLSTNKGLFVCNRNLLDAAPQWKSLVAESATNALPYAGKIYVHIANGVVVLDTNDRNVDQSYFNLARLTVDTSEILISQLNNLPAGTRNLTFEFDFINFDGLRPPISYTLSGPITESIRDAGNTLKFRDLTPGQYTLQAQADQRNSKHLKKEIHFNIPPKFHQTLLFRIAFILFALGILVAIVWLIVWRRRVQAERAFEVKRLLLEYQSKAMRMQMNPHFIFNALNTLQRFILENKRDASYDYLQEFAALLRDLLESSDAEFISLQKEIQILTRYIEIEKARFSGSFVYEIVCLVEKSEKLMIPLLLIQPVVENAIWHGLLHKTGERTLKIEFTRESEYLLVCKVFDNGIGLSSDVSSGNHVGKRSMGTSIINERLKLLGNNAGLECGYTIREWRDDAFAVCGTEATIIIPIL